MSGQYTFSNTPVIKHARSKHDLSHGIKTSANVGTLYPLPPIEVYPGDTFKDKESLVVRLSSSFIRPVVDNLFIDMYHFFVPSRTIYDKFVNVFGENTESAWANTREYSVPTVNFTKAGHKTVGDYMGLPTAESTHTHKVSVLPFRAFAKVYNEWFRDQNNVDPMHINVGEVSSGSESFNNAEWAPFNYMGKLPKVARMHDLFSSSLPAPQKGEDVAIPININVPVKGGTAQDMHSIGNFSVGATVPTFYSGVPFSLAFTTNSSPTTSANYAGMIDMGRRDIETANLWNLMANGESAGFNVAEMRFAFTYQRLLERDAQSGSRYCEYLASHFNVYNGDARLQRSEFLGGNRTPLNITQVTQTTGSDSSTAPLAQVGAFSATNARNRWTKSFTEHGYIISVFCIRQFHTYQQGIDRMWTRSKREEFYDPVFAHLSNQPVYKKELYSNVADDDVFGYQDAWYDLRQKSSKITGQMRNDATDSLDVWHFGDYYSTAPVLGKQFIEETATYVDRAITVNSTAQDQFILDIFRDIQAVRAMPVYSLPGLIDHN